MICRLSDVVTVRRTITKLHLSRPRLDPYTFALTAWTATVNIDPAVLVWIRGGRSFFTVVTVALAGSSSINAVFTFHSRAVCCWCQCLIHIRLAVHILLTSLLLHAEGAIVT